MDFVLVGVGQELVQEGVGAFEFEDAVSRQERRETFLPVVVAAFNFAFGLWGRGVTQGHAVEVEGGSELGEGVGIVGVEKGMEVDVESQGQAFGLEDAGKEVEVGQKGFARVAAGTGVDAGGVVEEIQENLLVRGVGEPGVRAGVVLPEGAQIAGLPAVDRFGGLLVAGVGSEFFFDGPTADTGTVGFEGVAAEQFAGEGAVGEGGLEERRVLAVAETSTGQFGAWSPPESRGVQRSAWPWATARR